MPFIGGRKENKEDLLGDRGGRAESGSQLVESTFTDRAGLMTEDEEDDGGQGHDTEDGPEPVRAMSGQVVVGIGLITRESALGTQMAPCHFSSVNQREYTPG